MRLKLAILLIATGASAQAQSTNGYIFFAPGGATSHGYTSMMLHTGGGVDAHLYKGIAANLEIGALGPQEEFSQAVGLFSAGPTYRFLHRRELKWEPFVAGGYSLMFRSGHANLYYFGGGTNAWVWKRVGFRLEFRDHVYPSPAVHFWGFRFGLAFR